MRAGLISPKSLIILRTLTRAATGLACLALCAPAFAGQNGLQEFHGALVSAKIGGGCSILVQMSEFQKTTKMPGGYEFIDRFLRMESARLGKTTDEYLQMCIDADRVYQRYYNLTSDEPEQK